MVAWRSQRAQAGDGNIFFKGYRGRHDFTINRANRFGAKGALTPAYKVAEKFHFPVGRVDGEGFPIFYSTDFLGVFSALIQKSEQLGIEGIDFLAKGCEIVDHGRGFSEDSPCPLAFISSASEGTGSEGGVA